MSTERHLTLENGTTRLSRNVRNQSPNDAGSYSGKRRILFILLTLSYTLQL